MVNKKEKMMKINRENKVQHLDDQTFEPDILKGKKVIATGTLNHFSRKGIEETITNLGGTYASSVSGSLDFVIEGENAGSKLQKAKELGVLVIDEEQFVSMITRSDKEEKNEKLTIDISLVGYGYIVDFKLLNEQDLTNIKNALNDENIDLSITVGFDMNDELYDVLYDTDYEISDDYDNGFIFPIFKNYHEITITDSFDENNKFNYDSDDFPAWFKDEPLINFFDDRINTDHYSHIMLNVLWGNIADHEDCVGEISRVNKLADLSIDNIKPVSRGISVFGEKMELWGDNWEIIRGKGAIKLAMPISEFKKLKLDFFDHYHIDYKDYIL
jgi:hypothetical protein